MFYFAFFSNDLQGLTGFSVSEPGDENSILIDASLSVPDSFVINDDLTSVLIEVDGSSSIVIDGKKVGLKDSSVDEVLINGFDGSLIVRRGGFLDLDGVCRSVSLDKIPISADSGSSMDVFLEKNFKYDFLRVVDVNIPMLSYKATGKLVIGDEKVSISLKDEDFEIKNFFGEMVLVDDSINLKGFADRSKVLGSLDITSSKKDLN